MLSSLVPSCNWACFQHLQWPTEALAFQSCSGLKEQMCPAHTPNQTNPSRSRGGRGRSCNKDFGNSDARQVEGRSRGGRGRSWGRNSAKIADLNTSIQKRITNTLASVPLSLCLSVSRSLALSLSRSLSLSLSLALSLSVVQCCNSKCAMLLTEESSRSERPFKDDTASQGENKDARLIQTHCEAASCRNPHTC